MKVPRPGHSAGAGEASGKNTKGYSAGAAAQNGYGTKGYGAAAGEHSNGGGAKTNKPAHGAGSYTFPGQNNGFGAGFGSPYAGKPQQPGYGQGAYPAAGYGNGHAGVGEAGKSTSGYGNSYSAGVQPDYANLGQGLPTANGKSGMSQFHPQSAGLGPNKKLGGMYGGMGGSPYGSPAMGMGAERGSPKYGIGGLQFGVQPHTAGMNGAANYGYGGSPYGSAGNGKSSGKYGAYGAGMGGNPAAAKYAQGYGGLGTNGNAAGRYGYGRMPYEPQTAGLSPEAKSAGQYGVAGSQYQQSGKSSGKYGGAGEASYAPQQLGFGSETKSSYGHQGPYQPQPIDSAPKETAGLSFEPAPADLLYSSESPYVNGELPTPVAAATVEENVGYINGQVQPEVVAFPAAPSDGPTLAYPSDPAYLPVESSYAPDAAPAAGAEDAAGAAPDAESAAEMHDVAQQPEQPEDEEQLPRQIHIQQHLKLHFHNQGTKSNGNYDLNGFFGNGGYQG
ncbi:uncharacterized protein LOC142893573 isoform X49 [Nelusetta ayraudi]|uniref:uncharacterized protein LOC142893573 isoform X49 n=1 Tax=Nelusetta ayraudi TaxID=303726 RepID=UPI003F717E6D